MIYNVLCLSGRLTLLYLSVYLTSQLLLSLDTKFDIYGLSYFGDVERSQNFTGGSRDPGHAPLI